MHQYTNTEQTAKLIELGFEKPKNRLVKQRFDRSTSSWIVVGEEGGYSIGELIKALPKHIFHDGKCMDLQIYTNQYLWVVKYSALFYDKYYRFSSKELIDALFDMVITLKDDGVI